jgi:hypothetical protein
MKLVIAIVLVAACGGSKPAPANPGSGSASASPSPSDDDTLTETHAANDTPIHQRRNAACEQVGAKVSACAVEDTRNDTQHPPTADELKQLDQTAAIDKREFIKKCEATEMSSRQVRVMEVCVQQETACDPFLACLDHMNDKTP